VSAAREGRGPVMRGDEPAEPATPNGSDRVDAIITELEALHDEMRRQHVRRAADLSRVHPAHRQGAANLIDYLTLRRHDVRSLQGALAELGLSSLGRAEEHVIVTLERVLRLVYLIAGRTDTRTTEAAVGFGAGRHALEVHAEELLGPTRRDRTTRILVTMPTEASDDLDLVRALMRRGMDCARINCAHDDAAAWTRMAGNIRRAAEELHLPCPILMDLPGPKLRTGPIEPGPNVVRLRPRRDALGRPVTPAGAVLVATDGERQVAPASPTPALPVARRWLEQLRPGDLVRLRDTRQDPRTLVVTAVGADGAVVETWDTTYLVTGTELATAAGDRTRVGELPALEQALVLDVGDVLTLTTDLSPAPVVAGEGGRRRVRIGCTLPEALAALRSGHRVLFDDGKIGGQVLATRAGEADVRITMARPGGSKLRAEKGINMPDSNLRLAAFGPADEGLLRFIADNADLVALSFAQDVNDVRSLQEQLGRMGSRLGIMIKIETARGFEILPELLLQGMQSERLGVMVARGDLAVECGFERLAELQEEILWLCDAAHVPVVWATQVLDRMARTGQPSRAEISDAAMSGRAECVMLNKGPHIVEAVAALDDILRRMSTHQQKKVALLRRLRSWSPNGE